MGDSNKNFDKIEEDTHLQKYVYFIKDKDMAFFIKDTVLIYFMMAEWIADFCCLPAT